MLEETATRGVSSNQDYWRTVCKGAILSCLSGRRCCQRRMIVLPYVDNTRMAAASCHWFTTVLSKLEVKLFKCCMAKRRITSTDCHRTVFLVNHHSLQLFYAIMSLPIMNDFYISLSSHIYVTVGPPIRVLVN